VAVEDVYVHVGPHKTGTTFVQRVLRQNKAVLRAAGGHLPANAYLVHRDAAEDLLAAVEPPRRAAPVWDALAARALDFEGRFAIISAEQLDRCDEAAMERVAGSFGDARVHVVYTARDLSRVIPAMWHTRTRNGHHETWDTYVRGLREAPDSDSWPWGMAGQNPERVLARWARHVPQERIHLVTVPRPGAPPDLLWHRFAAALELRAEDYALESEYANPSLGAAEVELLRRLNEVTRERLTTETYNRWVRREVIRGALDQRSDQQRYALEPDDYAWVREHSQQVVAGLRSRGYHVVGDLDELVPLPAGPHAPPPTTVRTEQVLDAAVDALASLVVSLHEQSEAAGRRRADRAARPARRARRTTRRTARQARAGLRTRVVRALPGPVRSRLRAARHRLRG
jgi:hypothetical protein